MKLLFDFLPIALFFGAFRFADVHRPWAAQLINTQLGFAIAGGRVGEAEAPVLLATVVVIAASVAQVAWLRLTGRRVEPMLWLSLGLVCVLGGATVWFHDPAFIMWKPSALYWAMGLTLWLSRVVFRRDLLRALLGERLELPSRVWHRLNFAWVAFLAFMGLLNLFVAYSFPAAVWVDFKLFGGLGLMLAFTLAQAVYLSRFTVDEKPRPDVGPGPT